jgi:hypothetical protein
MPVEKLSRISELLLAWGTTAVDALKFGDTAV